MKYEYFSSSSTVKGGGTQMLPPSSHSLLFPNCENSTEFRWAFTLLVGLLQRGHGRNRRGSVKLRVQQLQLAILGVAGVWVFLCGADRWTSRERLQRADVRWKTSYKDVVKRTLSPWQAHQNQRTVWGALLWCNLTKRKTFPVEEKHLINNRTLGANGKGIRRKAHLEPTREEPRHLRTMCFPYLGSYFLICIHSFFLT